MPASTRDEIIEQCRIWSDSLRQPDGSLHVGGPEFERHRLLSHGFDVSQLDYAGIRGALVGLLSVLAQPGRTALEFEEHVMCWTWCADIVVGSLHANSATRTGPAIQLLRAVMHAYRARPQGLQAGHVHELVMHTHLLRMHLCFPLLECVLKMTCSNYVAADGNVLQQFFVSGKRKDPGTIISSLRDLLQLAYDTASPTLNQDLNAAMTHLRSINPGPDGPFTVIYSMRNSALHGVTSPDTISGVVVSLAFLIFLDRISVDYDHCKTHVLMRTRFTADNGLRWPDQFYPPD